MVLRPPTSEIPDAPGSYQFFDAHGRVIYVGKAASLRSRLVHYFGDPAGLHGRTAQMVAVADRVEWVVVATEADALLLEHSLIQVHQPRFNIRLKDDKTYPWLALSVADEWPRPFVYRGAKRRGVQYFGPFPHVRSLRRSLDLLVKSFPLRTCSDTKFQRHERLGRPCLLYDLERCSGPCISAVDPEQYQHYVEEFQRFYAGDTEVVLAAIAEQMTDAAQALDYERAARHRDQLTAVRSASESQEVVVDHSGDFDAFGIAANDLEAAVAIVHVRRGRIVGRHGFVVDRLDDGELEGLVGEVLERYYDQPGQEVPQQVLVSLAPRSSDAALISSWLTERRGGRVGVVTASRGRRRQVVEMAVANATEDLGRHQLRRAADHNARSKALTELQVALGLSEAPLRIECYDMSHLQGTDYVGSMVVFEDGLSKRQDYRHFLVKTVEGNDDFAAMAEVLRRRLQRIDEEVPAGGRRRFAYRPQLLLIDGGKGQLSAVTTVLDELGLTGSLEVASLAKQFEEVYRPGQRAPIIIPRGSEALYLLQRVRDEAHRFAITFHRQRRGNRMTMSALDGIAGLGAARRQRLLETYGTMAKIRDASLAELEALSWLPTAVAHALYQRLHDGDRDHGPARPAHEGGGD